MTAASASLHHPKVARAWIAQYAWRHKSRKTSFQVEFWLATLVNVGVFVFFVVFGVEALL